MQAAKEATQAEQGKKLAEAKEVRGRSRVQSRWCSSLERHEPASCIELNVCPRHTR